ncbi:cytochrome c oxidase subunit II [Silvimonas sp. JCM 19000]
MSDFQLHPVAATAHAAQVDTLFYCMLALTGTVALALAFLITFFSIKYRKGSNARRDHPPTQNRALELSWMAIPLLLFLGVFGWAAWLYAQAYQPAANAMTVFVVAKQWMWKVQHDNGRREINELHVAVGQPVRLMLASEDVIHSFYVPAFRIKQDVIPGRYTSISFNADRAGTYELYCAVYCGTAHATMEGRVIVMPPADYARWLESGDQADGLSSYGQTLYRQYGCSGCHDAGAGNAPALTGVFGQPVQLADGRRVIADEGWLREAILQPHANRVAGYPPNMPAFAGQLQEEELAALIAYLRRK